ncbi:MAG: HyaD/HybD family hydrogenase maturation endopeptidase [Dehalococcoidia bacterium]|uniref:HyaD/HybD family hydrogenase maturation endopeptidase n=1 Tax=Candidatus Amarobacter glycogenicus TaxID=3140699 RepID=UPI002A1169FE|nr:HyaD/HybD family hydrogenase maturation endopeptidase [Dehalococcoidia bacterium]MBK7124691.1 HyaD/HybD family hydrogenase maturation endopeptidase [Dehalococcoidia bacterium]MBK9610603.1 HyaD/HybD family hydrogenase maturation endopeptidase [Dehalococcoidia bacterium]MCC6266316.1 HyaD/HybD family hydrogenase maturation endopeptidase [Dehalococcoidia bacterium]
MLSELGHPPRTVILGIGNVLMQDEGAGVHAVRAIAEQALGPGFEVVDGGTLGIELLPIIEDAGSLILIDAARFGGAPGDVRAFRGQELNGTYGGHVSPHQAGAADLIAVARLTGALPERCTLFGIAPLEIGFGLELSGPVAGALPALIEAVLAEARFFSEVPANA